MLVDAYNRVLDYLRIAVTDRCNLRCVYCMPEEGIDPLPHSEILSYEEILRVVRLSVGLGIKKVRLTGGEPLVRRGIENLVSGLSRIEGLTDLSMTTNGLLLRQKAEALRRAGLKRVNVSLDSLNPQKYRKVTRGGNLDEVWEGIEEAMRVGLRPVKINVVAMDSQDTDELMAFGELAAKWPLEVRFIEKMPVGPREVADGAGFLSGDAILDILRSRFSLRERQAPSGNGPARIYELEGGKGTVGIIAPMTRHFCDSCNRLRLTPDGRLRVCLFSDEEMDLKGLLRSGAKDREIAEAILEAISTKPKAGLTRSGNDTRIKKCVRPMNRIGG